MVKTNNRKRTRHLGGVISTIKFMDFNSVKFFGTIFSCWYIKFWFMAEH